MKSGKKAVVKVSELKANQFQRERLTAEQEGVARDVWCMVKDAGLFAAFEQFESGFLRDMHPERELGVWLWIAQRYREYMTKHPNADRKAILLEFLLYTTKTKKDRKEIRDRLGFSDQPL